MLNKKISLENCLLGYKVLHTPTELSPKSWSTEKFSNDEYHNCTFEEQEIFNKRLIESNITVFDNIKMTTNGKIIHIKDLLNIIQDPKNKHLPKLNKPVLYTSNNGNRPVNKTAYNIWSGLQVIDMDIKNKEATNIFKKEIFLRLKKYNWFLGVAISSSGAGLHIYTKIQVPSGNENDYLKSKILYLTNFRHKYSFIYLACLKIIEYHNEWTNEDILKWLDMSMFKPQQGAFISYDDFPYINTNFFEDMIYVNFDNVEDMGHPSIDWVSYPILKELFKRWEWFENEEEDTQKINITQAPVLEFDINNKYHYKHIERWKLANTLVRLYGFSLGYKYLRNICNENILDKEIKADCVTAERHNKDINLWAINRLNKFHGFNIKVDIEKKTNNTEVCETSIISLDELSVALDDIEDPTLLNRPKNIINFYINKNQYIASIKDNVLKNINKITLIDAGPGTGKTELVKELAKDGKHILLVMPFTSTIKSKIEDSNIWATSFANKSVKLDKTPCVCMTVDKFSKLNVMDIKESGFDYIFIDESHLLFQSEYRPIMSNVIEQIKNSEVPIIMMSGTPIGESIFFPNLTYIKITKEDTRKKKFDINICTTPSDMLLKMCKSMAEDISNGRRILFPTNKGSLYKEEIETLVKYFLEEHYFWYNPISVNYYKKSNNGEPFMDDINCKKTINKTDILLCSTYLSVGVDILDKFEFSIYFNEIWTPQEIEQFSNRLRSHDLFIKLFINRQDALGNDLSINKYTKSNFKLSNNEIKDAHSIIRLCNNMIDRNNIEYKYNSLVSSILKNTKYIIYNNIENKYYLNEIAYKTVMFERKYRVYSQQLPVLIKGMISYNYICTSKVINDKTIENLSIKDIKVLKQQSKLKYKNSYNNYINELLDMLNESRLSIYKDVISGKYEIIKGNEWKEDIYNNIVVVKNIEVFEKTIPIIVSMSKMFNIEDIKSIFKFCINTSGFYNFSAIHRLRMLINIIYNNKKDTLDLPIKNFMKNSYEFLENHLVEDNIYEANHNEIKLFINTFVEEYANTISDDTYIILNSPITIERMQNVMYNIFKCLINIGRPNKNNMCKLEKIEILWKTKEEQEKIFNKSIDRSIYYAIEDFLGIY